MSKFLKAIGVLTWVGGFVIGIVLGKNIYGGFSFGLALVYWSVAAIQGAILYSIGMVLDNQETIYNKIAGIETNHESKQAVPNDISQLSLSRNASYQDMEKEDNTEKTNVETGSVEGIDENESAEETIEDSVSPIVINEDLIRCPNCRKLQSKTRETCFQCGKRFLQ